MSGKPLETNSFRAAPRVGRVAPAAGRVAPSAGRIAPVVERAVPVSGQVAPVGRADPLGVSPASRTAPPSTPVPASAGAATTSSASSTTTTSSTFSPILMGRRATMSASRLKPTLNDEQINALWEQLARLTKNANIRIQDVILLMTQVAANSEDYFRNIPECLRANPTANTLFPAHQLDLILFLLAENSHNTAENRKLIAELLVEKLETKALFNLMAAITKHLGSAKVLIDKSFSDLLLKAYLNKIYLNKQLDLGLTKLLAVFEKYKQFFTDPYAVSIIFNKLDKDEKNKSQFPIDLVAGMHSFVEHVSQKIHQILSQELIDYFKSCLNVNDVAVKEEFFNYFCKRIFDFLTYMNLMRKNDLAENVPDENNQTEAFKSFFTYLYDYIINLLKNTLNACGQANIFLKALAKQNEAIGPELKESLVSAFEPSTTIKAASTGGASSQSACSVTRADIHWLYLQLQHWGQYLLLVEAWSSLALELSKQPETTTPSPEEEKTSAKPKTSMMNRASKLVRRPSFFAKSQADTSSLKPTENKGTLNNLLAELKKEIATQDGTDQRVQTFLALVTKLENQVKETSAHQRLLVSNTEWTSFCNAVRAAAEPQPTSLRP